MSGQCLSTLFLVLVSLSPCISLELPEIPYARMIGDMEHRFRCKCTFIVYEQRLVEKGLGIQQQYLKLWKELPAYDVTAAFLPHHSFQEQRWNLSCATRPLYVISLSWDSGRDLLREVSRDRQLGFTVLSTVVNWREPMWLVFTHRHRSMEQYLSDVRIPYNARVMVVLPYVRYPNTLQLSETFSTDYNRISGKLTWLLYGTWNLEYGLLAKNVPFYEHRHNLHNVTFTVQTLDNHPYTVVTEGLTVTGFVGQVWNLLEKRMYFRTSTLPSTSNVIQATGVLGNETTTSLVLCDMPINCISSPKLEYTVPLYSSKFQVYVRQPGSLQQGWSAFLTPFSPALWLVVATTLLLVAGALCGAEGGGLAGAVLTAYGAFCSQGADPAPVSTPGRLSLLAGFLSVVVVAASYSADLMASLTVHRSELPFRGLKGLLAHGGYSLGVVRGSAEEMLFQSYTDTDLAQAYKLILNDSSTLRPRSRREALERVCASQFALLLQKDQADALRNSIPCRIEALPDFSLPLSAGIPFTKNHPYLGIINYNLLKLRRSGVLGKLLDGARPPMEPAGLVSSPGVGLEHVQSMLGVLALGAAAAGLVAVCEGAAHGVARRARRRSTAGEEI